MFEYSGRQLDAADKKKRPIVCCVQLSAASNCLPLDHINDYSKYFNFQIPYFIFDFLNIIIDLKYSSKIKYNIIC